MPAVDPAAAAAASAPTTTPRAPAEPGFAHALRRAGAVRVTLGEMIGADPLPAGAFATAGPLAAHTTPSAARADGVDHPAVGAAAAYLGVPYRWGGTDPATGLDCSGLVQRAFADIGVDLPRVSADQARAGVPVATLDDARPGDLVYWAGRDGRPNHIGIYVGRGQMLHAPRTGEVVQVSDVRAAAPDAIRRVR